MPTFEDGAWFETSVLGLGFWIALGPDGAMASTFDPPSGKAFGVGRLPSDVRELAQGIQDALSAYSVGDFEALETVPRMPASRSGGFWGEAQDAIDAIPAGSTVSYSELAYMAGNSKAHRAAASACANNPLPLFRPCHRVVAKGHKLGGFGFDLSIKAKLLAHEGAEI